MAAYDYGGWVIFGNGTDTYNVLCETQPELGIEDPSATWLDYPGDGHAGWTLDTRKRTITIKKLWFESTANYEAFMAFFEAAQDTGLTLKIQISTTPTYWDWDGANNYTMPVMWDKPRGIKKKFGGDTGIWIIGQVTFRQSGALA